MITIYKTTREGLQKIHAFEKDCWINIVDPTKEELDRIIQELHVPLDFLTDPLDIDERARIEVEDNVILSVLRIPRFEGADADIPFTTIPLGIIFCKEMSITICNQETVIISDMINGNEKNFSTTNGNRFLFRIFLKTALLYLKYLKEINKKTTVIEKELQVAMKNEELIKLFDMEKSLVYFTTALKSDELMIERLQKTEYIKMNPEDNELLEDVTIEYKQAIEMTNVYSNILTGMMDAFASVISNNLNVVLKFLTSVTIILMIPTLVASIYGMNVELPFQHSSFAFLITMVISFGFSIIGILIFRKRNWF
jgi:magnesium transporter